MWRYFLLFILAARVVAADFSAVGTNVVLSTNVFVSAPGEPLNIGDGQFVVSAAVVSPSNHLTTTVHFFWQLSVDGTNWTRTNVANSLVATTYNGSNTTTRSVSATNWNVGAFQLARIAGWQSSTVTNTVVTNVTISSWRK